MCIWTTVSEMRLLENSDVYTSAVSSEQTPHKQHDASSRRISVLGGGQTQVPFFSLQYCAPEIERGRIRVELR